MSPIVKRKRQRFKIPSKYFLLLLTIFCVSLMVVTFLSNFTYEPVNSVVGTVIVPFQKGISSVGKSISTRMDELKQLRDVLDENEALKAQVAELTVENIELQQETFELNSLRELYKIDEQYSGYEKIGARIIAKDASNWFDTFIIDKGLDDGLQIDMNVLAGGGLVGKITSIGSNWARVTSIIDDSSNLSGMVLSTSDNIIVSGNLETMAEGVIEFEQLVDSADKVVVGDKVVTSNISTKYLPGILIGYISNIQPDSNNLTKHGLVTPAVDFEHLEEVLIILEVKEEIVE